MVYLTSGNFLVYILIGEKLLVNMYYIVKFICCNDAVENVCLLRYWHKAFM